MLFLISLVLAISFVMLCGKVLRSHPAPFYIAALLLSIGAVCTVNIRLSGIPAWVNSYVIAQFTKGTFATACWAIVMWTGALPNGSAPMKRLMPVRGQLSIFTAILTLGHGIGYGISYLPRWLMQTDLFNPIVCIVLLAVMIPLTVLSVQKIRRKMKAKRWKQIQRFAYLFYLLIPLHVFGVNLAKARAGRDGAWLNLMIYAAVFIGYAVCRIRKWYLLRKKPERRIGGNLISAAACVMMLCTVGLFARPEKQPEHSAAAEIPEIAVTSAATITTTATETTSTQSAYTAASIDTTTAADTTVQTDTETSASEHTTARTAETVMPEKSEENVPSKTVPHTEAVTTTTQPQTSIPESASASTAAAVYQDGTYQASAYGYDGEVHVTVTIQNDTIVDIQAYTEESDDWYFGAAKNHVITQILNRQNAQVDAQSGATYSSDAIMAAVQRALNDAKI